MRTARATPIVTIGIQTGSGSSRGRVPRHRTDCQARRDGHRGRRSVEMDAIGGTVMHRLLVLFSVVAVALIVLAALGAHAGAQEAPPVTEVVFDRVDAEVLASGRIPAYPSEPAGMVLLHLRFEPEGRVLIPADDPGLDLVYVEAGAVTIHINVPVVAMRGAGLATPQAQAQEEFAADTEFTLRAGDSFVAPALSGGEMRSIEAETRVLIAYVAPVPPATPTP